MPLSKAAIADLRPSEPCHIGIALPLDPAHASLALWLKEAGFQVTVLVSDAPSQFADMIAALDQSGVTVRLSQNNFAECDLDILLDTNGDMLREMSERLKGATSFDAQLTHDDARSLPLPVVNLGESELIQLCTLNHGLGQACVSGFLDITNLQIAGTNVLVLGYGAAGQGVAKFASAYGARITVCDDTPLNAARARLDGHRVLGLREALPQAQVVFAASREMPPFTFDDLEHLPSGAFLCSASQDQSILPFEELQSEPSGKVIRDHVVEHRLPSGKAVKLVCEGRPIHLEGGDGLPLEYADIAVAAQLRAIALLIDPNLQVENGVQPLPPEVEDALSKAFSGQE